MTTRELKCNTIEIQNIWFLLNLLLVYKQLWLSPDVFTFNMER